MHAALADLGLTPYTTPSTNIPVVLGSKVDIFRKKSRVNTVIRGLTELHPDNFILPPRSVANDLVDLFFEHAFPLYPFVHQPSFRARINKTYDNAGCDAEIPWQALMNLVFAFGCDYLDIPLSQSFEIAQTYHRRGAELILSVCFDTSTVEVVQALLLLSCHLQSNLQFNRVWTSIGSILRAAQTLGFHMDPGNWKVSHIEKELRRRLWWGIYSLDR